MLGVTRNLQQVRKPAPARRDAFIYLALRVLAVSICAFSCVSFSVSVK